MAITIEAGVLSRAMKSAAAIIEGSNTIPILANVRLQAEGEQLEIVTSNMDVEYRQRMPLVDGAGLSTTVDARRLAAIAGATDSGAQISLDLSDGRLVTKSGRSRWLLPVLPAADFPAMTFATEHCTLEISGKQLAGIIGRILWSACTEETRYYLCGIFLDPEEEMIRFTTTNGISIASLTSDLAWPEYAPAVIIPSKLARIVDRVFADFEQVTVNWDASKIRFAAGDIVLTGKLIDGTYPEYRRVIPAVGNSPILVDPATLRKALRRMELVGSEKTRGIAVDIRAGALEVQMADGGGGGEANEHVPANCEQMHRAGFNCGYLASALDAIGGDTVEIHQASPSDLALIRRAVPDGTICGVMPMRV